MHYLTNKIKGAWRHHKVVVVLFLDIEGAFLNAVTERLLHNMCMRQLPEPYVNFIDWMQTNRRTKLRFNGFASYWVNIDNGIVQGDPLLMLLYLFYNSNLIVMPKKEEAMIAYVNNASFYAEGENFNEAYARLWDMMYRTQGGYNWLKQHNLHFEPSKMALIGFSWKHEADPQCPRRLAPEIRPDFHLHNDVIKLSAAHKYLGIIFDQEPRWWEQVEQAMATAAKWMLQFRHLTKLSTSIRSRFMRQLYCAVAIPKFTYAADVWYVPVMRGLQRAKATRSVGATKRLASIQHMAITTISGMLHTTAMDVMEAHANVMPIELLMHKVCHRAAIRLVTLLLSHLLHKLVQICVCWRVKCHLSPIHMLLQAYNIDPSKIETIALASRPPNHKYNMPTEIASSREESKEADADDKATFKVYTDGSGQDGMASAAAVLYKGHTLVGSLHYHLGSLEQHTTYE